MRIAGPIILAVLGAILVYAVGVEPAEGIVNLSMVGWIMLIAAGVWFTTELVARLSGSRARSIETTTHADGSVSQHERRTTTNVEI